MRETTGRPRMGRVTEVKITKNWQQFEKGGANYLIGAGYVPPHPSHLASLPQLRRFFDNPHTVRAAQSPCFCLGSVDRIPTAQLTVPRASNPSPLPGSSKGRSLIGNSQCSKAALPGCVESGVSKTTTFDVRRRRRASPSPTAAPHASCPPAPPGQRRHVSLATC